MKPRSGVYPVRPWSAFQYGVIESKECRDVGVHAALEPVSPPGPGWQLVSSAIVGTGGDATCFHWWRRCATLQGQDS